MRTARRGAVCLATVVPVLTAGLAAASIQHPSVVIEDPADHTPQLVATDAVAQPHVDALARSGAVMYVGGLFDTVTSADGTLTQSVHNVGAFDAGSGALLPGIDPVVDGQVWALAATDDAVYVGGEFTYVDGVLRKRLVKLDRLTGEVDPTFDARFRGGRVTDLEMWDGRLLVAGSMGKKLLALDPVTGADTGFADLGIADPIPNAWGGLAVYQIAIDAPSGTLVATGNFSSVSDQPRTRLFVADVGGGAATLADWYYPGFAKPCSATHPRRIAYLQGVDFSPDGSYFVVTATGQIPLTKEDIWPTGSATYPTVCDAVGRFDLADDSRPVWINYTGGDSIWSAAATGPAVYVQGHFQWLDNPNGWASKDGGGASRRLGIGAIDPDTGKALAWNPPKRAKIGGKVLLADSAGLWVGSDSLYFNKEAHRGLAFVPLG